MGEYDTLLVNTYLFGIVTFQFATYYGSSESNSILITVLLLFLNDSVHFCRIYMAWFLLPDAEDPRSVENYTNPEILLIAPWPYPFTCHKRSYCCDSLYITFWAFRLYRLTGKLYLYVGLMIGAVTVFGLGITTGNQGALSFYAWIIHEVLKLIVLKPIIITWLVGQTVMDLFLTSSLSYVLYRSRTGFRTTDSVINQLIRGTIQTGVFSSMFAPSSFSSPTTNLYGMFAMPVGRIYTNTLMDTLISREKLKESLTSEPIDVTSTVIIRMGKSRQTYDNSVPSQIPVVNIRRGVYSETGEATEMNRLDSADRKHQSLEHDSGSEMPWAPGFKV
ncbi:hypothetical protein IW261DRAFT_1466719 [Armillaria novae-zelandiae]|uniref:DUF6534 domain-containing protein n=1 Tax=Armillaria novae-zelandiae TaxID=153914 RepID=A0AA39PDG0_9AGAR|nr:hypothetical protein IW261DRAFT_1466719 [Armillaria novae-zelandiae]